MPKRYLAWSVVLLGVWILAIGLQFFLLEHNKMFDATIWGNQAHYVETKNPEQFNWDKAYGHPGGTLVIGTSLVHALTHHTYEDSLFLFLALASAGVIAAICAVTYVLRRNIWWCFVAFTFLTLNPLYGEATPPSALASLLFVLMASLSLFYYEQPHSSWRTAVVWGSVAALICATRIDIGVLATIVFGMLLWKKFGARGALVAAITGISVFWALDPFMWFMPLQHLYDLVVKVYLHIAVISLEHPTFQHILQATAFGVVGLLLGLFFSMRRYASPQLPRAFLGALLGLTIVVLVAYVNAHNQGIRYLYPIVFAWEWLLPFMLLVLIESSSYPPPARRLLTVGMMFALASYPILIFFFNVW